MRTNGPNKGEMLPINHPWWGRLFPCICKVMETQGRHREWLWSVSGLTPMLKLQSLSNFAADRQHAAFEAVAQFIAGAANQPWLLLQGDTGRGKTHLAAAAVVALVNQGINAVYAYMPDVLERLRFGYEDGTYRQQWQFLRSCQSLVIDDIFEHQTPWVQEQLQGLLDYRLRELAPTMVCINLGLHELPARVRSRLMDGAVCRIIVMDGEDYRLVPPGQRRPSYQKQPGEPF